MKKFQKVEAFTGLEAAIVLIAFVVVAAVFSYVVLGAGFFTSQQAQKVVYSGMAQASSNLVILGNVYGDASGTNQNGTGSIHTLIFTVGLAAGGTTIDMNQTVLVYQNETILQTLSIPPTGVNLTSTGVLVPPGSWQWGIMSKQNANANNLLETNEQFTLMVNISPDPPTISNGLPASDTFTLQIRPSVGAALPVTHEAPGDIYPMNILY